MPNEPGFSRENERIGRMARGPVDRKIPPGSASRPVPVSRTFEPTSRPTGGFRFPQRVVVKIHYAKHRSPEAGRDSLRRHLRYLARESAAPGTDSPRFYDADHDNLDPKTKTTEWAADRYTFRVIVSPERGNDIADLRIYTRQVMQRVQRDLGTSLEWLAVNHFDTEHAHAHLLIRSRTQDGADLIIPRDYIRGTSAIRPSRSFRGRASEVATELLGERTIGQAREANAKEMHAERWTGLDRLLRRFATPTKSGHRIEPTHIRLNRHGSVEYSMLVQRLEFLTSLELAREEVGAQHRFRAQPRVWEVSVEAERRLRELGARGDVIKQLYASLGREQATRLAPQIQQLHFDPLSRTTKGILVAKGAIDELSDTRFMLVRSVDGKHHYTRVWPGEEYDAARVGGVVELGRRTRRQYNLLETIARVAERDEQHYYSAGRHRSLVEARKPQRNALRVERRLRLFAHRVEQLAHRKGTGITHGEDATYAVDPGVLRAFADRVARWPDVRAIACHSLDDQVQANACTWLDRLIARMGRSSIALEWMKDPEVSRAVGARIDWLLANGYAERSPSRARPCPIQFKPGAIRALRNHEVRQFAAHRKDRDGKDVYQLRTGQQVTGHYRGLTPLHVGLLAMIDSEDRLFAAPVARAPWAERGQVVMASRRNDGRVSIERASDRTLKPGLER